MPPPGTRAEAQQRVYKRVSPIHRAAALGRVHEAEELVREHGLGIINSLNDAGNTPLYAAVLAGQLEMVHFLLDLGCDMNRVGSDGKTPLDVAFQCGHAEIADELAARGAS